MAARRAGGCDATGVGSQRDSDRRAIAAAESFVPLLWPLGFYGRSTWLGWQLYGRESILSKVQPYVGIIVASSLLLYVPYYCLLPEFNLQVAIDRKTTLPLGRLVIESILTAYLSVSLSLASLLLAQRYLSNHSPAMRFIADSSYWVYSGAFAFGVTVAMLADTAGTGASGSSSR